MIRLQRGEFPFFRSVFPAYQCTGTLVQVDQGLFFAGHVNDSQVVESGSFFQTMQPTLNSSGYIFGYWTKGNERLSDVGGRSVTEATVSITEATTLTAHYFLSTEDTDGDGVMDWFEYRNFGDLSFNSTDDRDEDGFSNGQEDRLGQEPTIKDQVEDGDIFESFDGVRFRRYFHGSLFDTE